MGFLWESQAVKKLYMVNFSWVRRQEIKRGNEESNSVRTPRTSMEKRDKKYGKELWTLSGPGQPSASATGERSGSHWPIGSLDEQNESNRYF
jgi:hypothetical protein